VFGLINRKTLFNLILQLFFNVYTVYLYAVVVY